MGAGRSTLGHAVHRFSKDDLYILLRTAQVVFVSLSVFYVAKGYLTEVRANANTNTPCGTDNTVASQSYRERRPEFVMRAAQVRRAAREDAAARGQGGAA